MVAAQDFATFTVHPINTTAELGVWSITVLEVLSGNDAFTMLVSANNYNSERELATTETYVLVRISAQNTSDVPRAIQMSDFAATGTDGILRRTGPIALPEPMLAAVVDPGTATEGWIAPTVNDASNAILWFDSFQLGGVWSDALFALSNSAAPSFDLTTVQDTDIGSDPASPAGFGDTLTVGGWEITLDDVVIGPGIFDLFDFRTRALGSDNEWIVAGAAVHATVRNMNPFPAFFSNIAFEVADWSGEPWDQMPTLTVENDVSREYLPGGGGSGWAAFGGLGWTEYNLVKVAPFKVGGSVRYVTFGDATPASSSTDVDARRDEPADEAEAPASGASAPPLEVVEGYIVVTLEDLVNFRDSPSTSAAALQELPLNTELEISGPPEEADGYTWYPVIVVETGEFGYIVADFLGIPEN